MKEVEKQGDLPRYLFHKGENFTAYDYLGAHRLKDGGVGAQGSRRISGVRHPRLGNRTGDAKAFR